MIHIKVFLQIVTIILVIVFIAQVVFAIVHNRNLEKGFVKGDNVYAYNDALENGTVDPDQIRNLFPSTIAMTKLNQENTISSPRVIRYYENIGDALPVYVIEKGQSISVRRGSSLMDNVGYGFMSMPTNERLWRLAIPFSTESTTQFESLLYVKLDELQSVTGTWVEINNIRKARMLKSDVVRALILQVDNELYDKGIFLSKDILQPMWSPAMITTFILFALSLGASVFLRIRNKLMSAKT